MAAIDLQSRSTEELKSEIRKRERQLNSLLKRRDKLTQQLEEVNAEILEMGGAAGVLPDAGRKRHKNDANLADALAKLLAKKTMSVTKAAEQVQEAGYKTTSPNFRTIVNQTLLRDKRFKRVSRGQYTADASAKPAGRSTKKKTKKRNTRRAR